MSSQRLRALPWDLRGHRSVGGQLPSSTCRWGGGGDVGGGEGAGSEHLQPRLLLGIGSVLGVPDSNNIALPILIHMCFSEVKHDKLIILKRTIQRHRGH